MRTELHALQTSSMRCAGGQPDWWLSGKVWASAMGELTCWQRMGGGKVCMDCLLLTDQRKMEGLGLV